jgi:hypothetical protein
MLCSSSLNESFINKDVSLPYALSIEAINQAVSKTYKVFHGLNYHLSCNSQRVLEEMLLANTLSGMISEMLVRHISDSSETLTKNDKVGGRPDLLPVGMYTESLAHAGVHGIEIKASQNSGNWQGHNPEDGWLMIFRYDISEQASLRFTEILCAYLEKTDWNFAGRNGESRRTPTASINKLGLEKLRTNHIYRLPGFGIGKYKSQELI